jgi:hypothetical protein
MEWAEFERQFHEFATRAAQATPRRIMALYPQVPFRGEYPLRALHERMRLLAGAHKLEIPPAAWSRSGGTLTPDARRPRSQVFSVPDGAEAAIETNEYVFPSGPLNVDLLLAAADTASPHYPRIALEIVDAASSATLIHAEAQASGVEAQSTVRFSVLLPGQGLQRIRLRVRSSGQPAWRLADIRVPVNYAFEVLDLTDTLNAFPTHASAFDAHPNEAAQRAMAEALYNLIVSQRAP